MLDLEAGPPARVVTPAGAVVADRVVLALNAWSIRLPELRRALVVVGSDIVATEPMGDRLARLGVEDVCISDSRLIVNYYRPTRDGRLAFGQGGGALGFGGRVGARFHGHAAPGRAAAVAASMRALYPELADVGIATSWTGPIDRSMSGLPFFGALPGRPHVFYGTGFSGNGVAPTLVGSRVLASLVLGHDDEWSRSPLADGPPKRFPPEPVRYVGGLAVRKAVERAERAEDAGRLPSRTASALTALAPAGLVPTKSRNVSSR
jgi:glycine/D-amino acid oxidase-like deaminating enzyme